MKTFAAIGRLHIVAIAALGTLTFGWLFYGRRGFVLAAITALDWFLVNLLNRVVDLKEDRANAVSGTDFVAAHRRGILALGFGLLGASFVLVPLVAPGLTALRATFHALGFAYNWPLRPGWRRIKQLYFWKNTASATGFMLTVFGFPLACWGGVERAPLAPGVTPATVVLAAVFFFTFELSYEIIYDLRDAPGDAAAEVRTYPVVHGERGAARIVDALLGVSVASLGVGFAAGVVPWRLAVMGVAPLVQLVVYKRALRRTITSADCVQLTWVGAGLLLAYHLWIVAKLPGVSL